MPAGLGLAAAVASEAVIIDADQQPAAADTQRRTRTLDGPGMDGGVAAPKQGPGFAVVAQVRSNQDRKRAAGAASHAFAQQIERGSSFRSCRRSAGWGAHRHDPDPVGRHRRPPNDRRPPTPCLTGVQLVPSYCKSAVSSADEGARAAPAMDAVEVLLGAAGDGAPGFSIKAQQRAVGASGQRVRAASLAQTATRLARLPVGSGCQPSAVKAPGRCRHPRQQRRSRCRRLRPRKTARRAAPPGQAKLPSTWPPSQRRGGAVTADDVETIRAGRPPPQSCPTGLGCSMQKPAGLQILAAAGDGPRAGKAAPNRQASKGRAAHVIDLSRNEVDGNIQ